MEESEESKFFQSNRLSYTLCKFWFTDYCQYLFMLSLHTLSMKANEELACKCYLI